MNDHDFAQLLMIWYKKSARDLPWRKTNDPYLIWISEVMLQQTTVNTVIPYFNRWVKLFPNLKMLAQTPLEKVLKVWQGLGYYQRAKNIHKAAKIILHEHQGRVPDDPALLKKLPGFGPYTIGAVLSIAFDKRYSIIDANIRRVCMRLLAKDGYAEASQDKDILPNLEKLLPQNNFRIFNQAFMELGALVCRQREPICLLCPVKNFCQAYQKGIQEIIPQTKKKILEDISVSVGLLRKDHKIFIQKRPSSGLLADLWEFPGGKIGRGESPVDALKRELKEELNIEIKNIRYFTDVQHFYTQFRVKLHAFSCESDSTLPQGPTYKWTALKNLIHYPMPSGSSKIVDELLRENPE